MDVNLIKKKVNIFYNPVAMTFNRRFFSKSPIVSFEIVLQFKDALCEFFNNKKVDIHFNEGDYVFYFVGEPGSIWSLPMKTDEQTAKHEFDNLIRKTKINILKEGM